MRAMNEETRSLSLGQQVHFVMDDGSEYAGEVIDSYDVAFCHIVKIKTPDGRNVAVNGARVLAFESVAA